MRCTPGWRRAFARARRVWQIRFLLKGASLPLFRTAFAAEGVFKPPTPRALNL